ncbi:MAG: hypothetical protein ACD_11C00073G0003, partial [uncultured bacterium]
MFISSNYISHRLILKFVFILLTISTFQIEEVQAFIEPPVLAITKPTPAAIYYINAEAVAGGNGTELSPWNEIEDADGNVVAGALIKIKGTFTGADDIQTWEQSGTVGNEIVFEPWGPDVATILYPLGIGDNGTGNNIIFDGGVDKKIIFDGSGLSAKYNLQSYGNNVTFYRIKSINNHKDAAMTTGTNISIAGGDDIRILNSDIYGCVSAGIYVQRGLNIYIKNNLIYDNGGQAIQLNPHNADL